MSTDQLSHPLDDTLRRLSARSEYLNAQLGAPADAGWIDAAALQQRDSPERMAIMQRIARSNQTEDRHFMAMSFWLAYGWQVLIAAVAAYLVEQRVPRLDPAYIRLHWNSDGTSDQVAFASGSFIALPGDPAAGHRDATVVPSSETLRRALFEEIARRFAPTMVETLAATSPVGTRALWAAVADRCAGAIIYITGLLGQPAVCRQEVAALVDQPPLQGKTGVLSLSHTGGEAYFLKRGSCCYSFKLSAHDYCATCPLLSIDERRRRLQAYLEEHEAA